MSCGGCDQQEPAAAEPARADDATIAARRDVCRGCDLASRSEGPRFVAAKGLTTRSTCAETGQLVRIMTQDRSRACPLGKWGSVTGVGSHLADVIREQFGEHDCGGCEAEIQRLDRLTVPEIEAQRAAIVQGMYERGSAQLGWWHRWAAKLAGSEARSRLSDALDEAIRRHHADQVAARCPTLPPGEPGPPDPPQP